MRCVGLDPKKVLLQWEVCFNGWFTLHGRFASMVDYFAWCASRIRASFSSSSPSPPPTQKEENKTKEEKLTLLWALGV
jgi:hypothetical protein